MGIRILVLAAALVAACAGPSVSVSVTRMAPGAELPAAIRKYEPATCAIEQADFEELAGLGKEERDLAAALRQVEAGRFAEAERALLPLSQARSEWVRERAKDTRIWALISLGRYGDAAASCGREKDKPVFSAFADAPGERVTFAEPSATLAAVLKGLSVPFVEVHLGDRSYWFLIDTGASFTVLSADVAAAAGIAVREGASTAGTATTKTVAIRPAVVPRLSVGNAVFENHRCMILNPADLEIRRVRIDGLLGWNAIRHLDVEVDFRIPQVTIREPRPRTVERNLLWLGCPLVRAHLADGVPLLGELDTGSNTTHLLSSFFEILPEDYWNGITGKTRDRKTRVWGAGGTERLPTRTVERLSVVLDRHVLELRRLDSYDRSAAAVFVPAIQFGGDIALKGTMRIDYANGAFELGP